MAEKGTGAGRAGKLRIRTPDHRWVEIPYGAGQDSALRSINVWDGSKWMCPTWGHLLYIDWYAAVDPSVKLPSVQYRTDKVIWTGWSDSSAPNEHWNNPNFSRHDTNAPQWTAEFDKWQRLFYVKPRTDPTYRVVVLGYPLPTDPPNVTIDPVTDTPPYGLWSTFFPGTTGRRETYLDGVRYPDASKPPYDQPNEVLFHNDSFDTFAQTYLVHNAGANVADVTRDQYLGFKQSSAGTQTSYQNDRVTYQVSMVDFKAIRQRLEKDFRYQDINWTGQKNDVRQQKLKRAYVIMTVNPWVSYWIRDGYGTPDGRHFDDIILRVKWGTGISTVPYPTSSTRGRGTISITADTNYPATTNMQNNVLWEATVGSLLRRSEQVHRMQVGQTGSGSETYWNNWWVGSRYADVANPIEVSLVHTFENLTEDSLAFSTEIVQPVPAADWTQPDPSQNYLGELTVNLSIKMQRIFLHYVDPGKDVPNDLRWDTPP